MWNLCLRHLFDTWLNFVAETLRQAPLKSTTRIEFSRFMRCQAEHQDRRRHGCQAGRLAVASDAQDVVRLPVLWRNFGRSSVGCYRHALRYRKIPQLCAYQVTEILIRWPSRDGCAVPGGHSTKIRNGAPKQGAWVRLPRRAICSPNVFHLLMNCCSFFHLNLSSPLLG